LCQGKKCKRKTGQILGLGFDDDGEELDRLVRGRVLLERESLQDRRELVELESI
jgi:hypothetical protein